MTQDPIPTTPSGEAEPEKDKTQQWLDDHPKTTGGLGCLMLLVIIGVVGAIFGWGDDTEDEPRPAATASTTTEPPAEPADPLEAIRDEEGFVSEDTFDEEWPLTVPGGVVACEETEAGGIDLDLVTFTDVDGNEYAVNGSAGAQTDAPPIDDIWADDPDIDGLKISIGPLIDAGLAVC